ncbi:30S ribosomal protein S16 [Spelaeicoccus albus]|uniref:Small ribosomal subunit protein bS16 n=1 Tax=Spelaeicoccus albus TaxID=1280376 RepID=A0A7Z0D2M6_9MICO|nr:30S ribosomal protein S16 [Spelaeicoccus albus]NYI67740.1 small subunit ribosomal protein S16 [Spelaeicoccus albus]
MAVKIRLKRFGKIRSPFYRVVIMDSRQKRDGRSIEEIGLYHPLREPSLIEIDSDRAQYWLGVGAQPSEQVLALLKITGDWQKFKGLPGAEGTLRRPEEKKPFEAPESSSAPKEAVTPKSKKAEKPEEKAEDKAEEKPADEKAAAEPSETGAEA